MGPLIKAAAAASVDVVDDDEARDIADIRCQRPRQISLCSKQTTTFITTTIVVVYSSSGSCQIVLNKPLSTQSLLLTQFLLCVSKLQLSSVLFPFSSLLSLPSCPHSYK